MCTWSPFCRRRAPLQTKPPAACPPGWDWTQKIQRPNNLSKNMMGTASLHFCIMTLTWLQDSAPFMLITPLSPAKPYLSGLYFHLLPAYIHRPPPKHITLTPTPFCSPKKCHVPEPLHLTCLSHTLAAVGYAFILLPPNHSSVTRIKKLSG